MSLPVDRAAMQPPVQVSGPQQALEGHAGSASTTLRVAAAPEGRSRTSVPTGARLAVLVMAVLLPVVAFATFLLARYSEAERARYQQDALDLTRQVSTAVDRELVGLVAALEALATSPALPSNDLAAFDAQARAVIRTRGTFIALRDQSGQQVINTSRPFGSPLGQATDPVLLEADARVFATGRPVISDLFTGTTTRLQLVTAVAPVSRDGAVAYALTISLDPARLAEILAAAAPAEWTVALVDRRDRIVARSRQHERLIGSQATESLRTNSSIGDHRTWIGSTLEGTEVFSAFTRSTLSGWRVAVGVPASVIQAPLERLTRLVVLSTGLVLALSLALAAFVARGIARPLRRLAEVAGSVGRGEEVAPPLSGLREADEIGRALAAAAANVRERETALRESEARLRDLNATLEQRVAEAIDERESAEAQLRQSQKMEAVGRLTGGVAHDFNNLLTVVTGNLDLLKRRLDDAAQARVARYVDNALDGATRAATLTARLLAFSRQSPLAPQTVDANKLVGGMSDLLQRTLGENISVETVLAGGLWRIEADPNQLESALLNLAVNARDAIPDGGRLTIETANAHLDEAYAAATQGEVRAGQYVLVSVSDTGQGIAPENLTRVFEPFFTTKPVGKGTGLGLAQVYGFAKQSGGHAAIYSEIGQGTTVKLYFPRLRRADDRGAAGMDEAPAPEIARLHASGETILVIEDEPMVRELSVVALEEAGYRVLAAGDGPSGLALLDAHPEIDLLFTDVVLTGPLNGREVADEAARRSPDIKVLFTTGYTRNAIIHHGRLDEGADLISKPFREMDLLRKLRRLLDVKETSAKSS